MHKLDGNVKVRNAQLYREWLSAAACGPLRNLFRKILWQYICFLHIFCKFKSLNTNKILNKEKFKYIYSQIRFWDTLCREIFFVERSEEENI